MIAAIVHRVLMSECRAWLPSEVAALTGLSVYRAACALWGLQAAGRAQIVSGMWVAT